MHQCRASVRYVAACIALVLGAQSSVALASDDTIVWAMVDWPPIMILKDGVAPRSPAELGLGSADQSIAEIIRRLPQYQHSFVLSNGQRIWGAMQKGQNLCYASALKSPERQAYATFTPYRLVPPMVLVVNKNRVADIVGNAKEVSLAQVANINARFPAEGRWEDSRSYGAQLNEVLAKGKVKSELVVSVSALLKPLANGLFGYTFEYPHVVEYMTETGIIPRTLDIFEIKESARWFTSYVACTRNAWGTKVIRDIDQAIRQAAATREYRAAVTRWTPEKFLRNHQDQLQEFFLARAQAGPNID